ncbi:hypothetical protein KBC70_02415 [Candidatus Woesebacteria bacterium]|nr:hypothetical protein [Candidatus Woesebacteria bacterium]
MKIIVTHQSPDLDALASVWLIRHFRKGWRDAHVEFVAAGTTLHGVEPDRSVNVMHVDTGFGMFDHHQDSEFTCAAEKVLKFLCEKKQIKDTDLPAIERVVAVVNRYDHFKEVFRSDAHDDMSDFSLAYIIMGLRANPAMAPKLVELAEMSLDGIFYYMKNKINAEKVIKKGKKIKTHWGKTIIMETDNDFAMKLAFFHDYDMAIRYSPHYHNVSIKVHPRSQKKLKKLHAKIIKGDKNAQWFYHASGRMLLNASTSDTKTMITRYSLKELIDIIQSFNTTPSEGK